MTTTQSPRSADVLPVVLPPSPVGGREGGENNRKNHRTDDRGEDWNKIERGMCVTVVRPTDTQKGTTMKVKGTATVCDICEATGNFVPRGEDDIEPALGLHIQRGQVHTGAGGGPLPNDTFVCIDCLYGDEAEGTEPVTAKAVADLVWGRD